MSKITNDGLTRSGRGRMFYSCTHMATVGVKGFNKYRFNNAVYTMLFTLLCVHMPTLTVPAHTRWLCRFTVVSTYIFVKIQFE